MKTLTALLLLAFATGVLAQQYRWVDDKGRVQYTDTPPPADAKGIQKKNLSAGPAGTPAEPYALQVALKRAPVKLFSTPDCGPACTEARRLLNQRGIPFSEVSIAEPAQLGELQKVSGGTTVPVLTIGSTVQRGYQEQQLHQVLDAAGYPAAGVLRPRNQGEPVAKPPAAQAPPEAPSK